LAQGAKTNKRRTLLALLLAISGTPSALAQQGWSPQPFVADSQARPLSSAPATPANRLRGDSVPSDDKPVVLRWRTATKSQPTSSLPASTVFDETGSNVVASFRETNSNTPSVSKTSQAATYKQTQTKTFQPAANINFTASNQNAVTPAANWTDRSSGSSNRIVRSVVEPEPFQHQETIQHQWNERNDAPVSIALAQFDVPPAKTPNQDAPSDLFEKNLLPPRDNPPTAPSNNSLRSLIEPTAPGELNKPREPRASPFPPSERDSLELLESDKPLAPPSRNRSPSDSELPPPNLRDSGRDGSSSRSVPPKPKSAKRTDITCDQVRERVLSANIGSIELDVAPDFGIGPKDKQTSEQKRATFSQSAASRSWHDVNGEVLIDGRLMDFSHDAIVVEAANGSRSRLAIRELSEPDKTYVFESWGLPLTCSLGTKQPTARIYEPTTVGWKASGLCHKPLYFEEIQLERSGHELGPIVQPVVSTAHFFKNVAFLPYKMGIHPMTECQYALGHYRPGNCAPWSIEPIPLSLRGAAAQAKVITGAALILP